MKRHLETELVAWSKVSKAYKAITNYHRLTVSQREQLYICRVIATLVVSGKIKQEIATRMLARLLAMMQAINPAYRATYPFPGFDVPTTSRGVSQREVLVSSIMSQVETEIQQRTIT
jgi:hypothetical protein